MAKTFLILVTKDDVVVKRIIKHGSKNAMKKYLKLLEEYPVPEYVVEVKECKGFF